MIEIMGIGHKIRNMRLKKGITQEILAQKIGVTPSAVGNYERGISFPKEPVLMKLFGALDCTPNELLGGVMFGERENAHLSEYTALDETGKARVDRLTQRELMRVRSESDEFEEVTAAARHGSAEIIKLKKRKGVNILDLPDYKGGGR